MKYECKVLLLVLALASIGPGTLCQIGGQMVSVEASTHLKSEFL